MPKFNLYQSLHTTVIGPDGKTIEVQIRSRDMHQRAEWGVASHWAYKDAATPQEVEWLNRIIDWQGEVSDPRQFLEGLKTDLEQDELFVFTPKGDVVALPSNATPVDFAYAVHTEVGDRCVGAKVNGKLVPLESHSRTAEQFATTAFSGATVCPEPKTRAPDFFLGYPSASSRSKRGALVPSASADAPQRTLSV